MTEGRDSTLLILLVGSNPLPNYLSACALRPSRLALVYTEQTKDGKQRLQMKLKEVLGKDLNYNDALVEDATDATAVRRAIDSLLPGMDLDGSPAEVWLNYTGGTKVMAAHARMAFLESKKDNKNASYLDEGGKDQQPRLRFDDGAEKSLAEFSCVPLNLQTILSLHGIQHTPREPKHPAPEPGDATEILCKVLQDVRLAASFYSESERLKKYNNPRQAVKNPFRADQHGLTLSVPVFPVDEQLDALSNSEDRESWFKQWYKFIGGEWLEEWVGEQTYALDLKPNPEIVVGVNARRGLTETDLEVDVAVVRGHRSYFISCTTDTTKSVCKSKLFEIAVRSRHLGGDLARAALICLAEDRVVSQLQEDIDDVWGASNTTKVFGLSDIRSWSDCGDKLPNRHSLKTWLES